MVENLHKTLKKISLFADLPDHMIAKLAGEVKERNLSAGEVLFNEGEEGDSLYFIQSGEVEIYQASDGKIFELLDAGDYFGEMALLEEKPRSASARIRTDASLLRLERAAFMTLLKKNPSLGLKMTSAISARLRTTMASSQPGAAVAKKGNTTKVFISYSRRDKEMVLKLNEAIGKHGIDTWVDWENIPLTADWWNEIRTGIENADAFAFIISPDSLTSEVCGREVQTAVDNHKRLIPILYRDPQKDNPMHEKISSHNWIYMRDDAEIASNVPQMLEAINTDLSFVRAHTRLLERALGWEREKKNASFVLQGDELQSAERWLEGAGSKQPAPSSLHIEFIQASRRAANQRQRAITIASLVGLGIAVVLAIVSFVFFLQARDAQTEAEFSRDSALAAEAFANEQASLAATAKAEAEVSRDDALVAEATAEAAKAFAEEQAEIALTEQVIAEAARAEAEVQKALAEEQALLARAGELAASAQTLLETNPPLSVLLALESDRLSPNNKTAQEVLSLLPVYFPPLVDTFIDPARYIPEIAWSPSGQLASASGDFSIILWNLETHAPDQVLSGHQDELTTMAWNADGRLASGSYDGTVIVWDLQTGEPEITLHSPEAQAITGVAWSPRGLLTYSFGIDIIVHDLSGQVPPRTLRNNYPIYAIAWNQFGGLAAGAENGAVYIWNVQTQRVAVDYFDHQAAVLTVAWGPDGSLASGSRDSTVVVRNQFGNFQARLSGHTDYVNVVSWSDDGRLASASWDKTVILWDLENEVVERVFRGHSASIGALDWGPNGQLTSGTDFIFIWDTTAAYALTTYPGHLDWVNTVLWTPQGQLVSAAGDSKVIFWDEETQTISESESDLYAWDVAVSSNNLMLSGGYVRDRTTGQEFYLDGYGHVFSPDGNFVVGLPYGQGNEFRLWPLVPIFETGAVISSTFSVEGDTFIHTVAWSPAPDGSTIATGQSDGTVILWDFNAAGPSATPRATLLGHERAVTELAWSADGRLASAGDDLTIIVWNVNTLEKDKVLTGIHDSPVTALSWSPNGELASITGDERIVIWDVEQEVEKAILGAPYDAAIFTVAWSPDGTQLALGGASYIVYVYNTLYVQSPCTWLTRNLTYEEWSFYLPGAPYQPTCPELPFGTAFEDEKAAVAFAFIDVGVQAIYDGDIAFGVERFEEAEAQGMEIDLYQWYDLCWWGALYNQAELSYFACERALELDPENIDFLQARGVSRALRGDFEGAIEDLETFVASSREFGYYPEEDIALREQWIEALREGINPFDEETLASLRGE